MRIRVLGIVLAGGKGTRLYPLTKERAKPAVPFGGKYRIIDFVLSNFINSGIYSIYVLTQFRSQSLLQHLSEGWQFGGLLKIAVHYSGAGADALARRNLVPGHGRRHLPEHQPGGAVGPARGGDLRRRSHLPHEHHQHDRVPRAEGARKSPWRPFPVATSMPAEFGVIEAAEDGRILAFHEKNPDAPTMPGDRDRVYASMGNYIFSTRTLLRAAARGRRRPKAASTISATTSCPSWPATREIFAYDFQTNRIPGEPADAEPYWRDVGTIDAYYEANMDLRSVSPALNLYNRAVAAAHRQLPDPPAKFTFDDENRRGQAIDSIVSGGCILSGGMVRNSVLGRGVRVHSGALVEDCVILDNCDIGRRASCAAPSWTRTCACRRTPRSATTWSATGSYHHVTESGIVVVAGERTPVEITDAAVCPPDGAPDGTADSGLDHAVRVRGHLRPAGAGHRGPAGAG